MKDCFHQNLLVFLSGISVIKDYCLVLERQARPGGSWWGQPFTKVVFIGLSLWSLLKDQQLENGFFLPYCCGDEQLELYEWHPWQPKFCSIPGNVRKYLLSIEKPWRIFHFSFWQVMAWLEWKELKKPDDQSVNTFFLNSECSRGKPNIPSNIQILLTLSLKLFMAVR